MTETPTKLPVKIAEKAAAPSPGPVWPHFSDLRREIDQLFDDFGRGWLTPFRSLPKLPGVTSEFSFASPAVDFVEKDTGFELTAELPGIAAKDVDVSMKNGMLVIKGEKKNEKEEKSKDYHLTERQYGSFQRTFALPETVDTSAIEARFANGILTVTLPKTAEAQKPAQKIEVKAA